MTKRVIRWFASGGDVARMGPFESQHEAYEALRLTVAAAARQREERGTASPYPHNSVVWQEVETAKEVS